MNRQSELKSLLKSLTKNRPALISDRTFWLLAFGIALTLAFQQTGIFERDIINKNGWPLVLQFLQASLHPDISWQFLQLTASATLKTLGFAVCGTSISLLFGSLAGIFASEVWQTSFQVHRGDHPKKYFISSQWLLRRSLMHQWRRMLSCRCVHRLCPASRRCRNHPGSRAPTC